MRAEDWPERLADCLEAARRKPFAWGKHDCVLFAADVVLAITGTDPAAGARGQYHDAAGARRWLGSRTLADALVEVLGDPIRPAFAQRGDLVILGMERDRHWPEAAGVCLGERAAAPGDEGLIFLPMSEALLAWRVD